MKSAKSKISGSQAWSSADIRDQTRVVTALYLVSPSTNDLISQASPQWTRRWFSVSPLTLHKQHSPTIIFAHFLKWSTIIFYHVLPSQLKQPPLLQLLPSKWSTKEKQLLRIFLMPSGKIWHKNLIFPTISIPSYSSPPPLTCPHKANQRVVQQIQVLSPIMPLKISDSNVKLLRTMRITC